MAAAAPVLRAEDFVLDPTEERIVMFAPLPGELVPAYLARRAASGFRPPRIHTFGVVRSGTFGYIAMKGINIEDIRRLNGIEVLEHSREVCGVRFPQDQKVYLLDDNLNYTGRRVAIEPTQRFPVAIVNAFTNIGSIRRMPEGMKQLYRGLPGLPSEVMNEIAGMAVAGAPPHYFSGAETRGGAVQPAYVNRNANRRAAMIATHEGEVAAAAAGGAGGAGGGGAAAPAPTKNKRSRKHRAHRLRKNRSRKQRTR